MFGNSKAPKKCPAAGCNKSFTYANCKDNKNLEKKIKAFERRQKRREEEEDAEEVIE
jgi:E3 SUMO-protein ligase NSE2